MSIDTNKLDISDSEENSIFKVSINSINSQSFDIYYSKQNVGRKTLIDGALKESSLAIISFDSDTFRNYISESSKEIPIDIFYPYTTSYAKTVNTRNIKIIIEACLQNASVSIYGTNKTPFTSNLVQEGTINSVVSSSVIVYSTKPTYLAEYEEIAFPEPICSYYSNPSANYYSSTYRYANNTRMPCCSNTELFPISDVVPVCSFTTHSKCSYYSPNETIVHSFVTVDKIDSSNNITFTLVKSLFNNFNITYRVLNNSVVSFEQQYSLSSDLTEEQTDQMATELFNFIVDDFGKDKEPVSIPVSVSKKNSFISSIVG